MVDYNKQKIECFQTISKIVETGTATKEDIAFTILEQTGFSEKLTKAYIDEKIKRGFFKVNSKGVLYVPK